MIRPTSAARNRLIAKLALVAMRTPRKTTLKGMTASIAEQPSVVVGNRAIADHFRSAGRVTTTLSPVSNRGKASTPNIKTTGSVHGSIRELSQGCSLPASSGSIREQHGGHGYHLDDSPARSKNLSSSYAVSDTDRCDLRHNGFDRTLTPIDDLTSGRPGSANRGFRPTLDGRLESRVVPAGHTAVDFTTNAYSNAIERIDQSVDVFATNSEDVDAKMAFVQSLVNSTKKIPYGVKVLAPVLTQKANDLYNVYHGVNVADFKQGLRDVVQQYVQENVNKGFIRYLQSGIHNPTDGDIPTSGRVGKGGKK